MEKIKWIEEYLEQALEIAWMEGHERALKLLDKLLYEEPGYARLHNTLGIIYMKYGSRIAIWLKCFNKTNAMTRSSKFV